MPFKNIDNPWLVKTLLTMLTVFGVIVGTALAPLFVVMFNPSVQANVDFYSLQANQHIYATGALVGGAFGFIVALGTLIQLARQAAQEARQLASGEHAPAAH